MLQLPLEDHRLGTHAAKKDVSHVCHMRIIPCPWVSTEPVLHTELISSSLPPSLSLLLFSVPDSKPQPSRPVALVWLGSTGICFDLLDLPSLPLPWVPSPHLKEPTSNYGVSSKEGDENKEVKPPKYSQASIAASSRSTVLAPLLLHSKQGCYPQKVGVGDNPSRIVRLCQRGASTASAVALAGVCLINCLNPSK